MDYLDPSQSGFRPSFGTETTLVILVDLDSCSEVLLILLDLSVVVNNINHGIFPDCLSELGVGGSALHLFR